MTTTFSSVRTHAAAAGTLWQRAVGIAGLAVVLWAGGDLSEVVTADSFGPGGPAGIPGADHRPPGANAPPDSPAPAGPGDSPGPASPGGHDPSAFDHG